MSDAVFAVESFDAVYPEIKYLWHKHYVMVATDRESIPLKPNVERYRELDQSGVLHVISARRDGFLVGYYFGMFVAESLHYCIAEAYSDIYYMECIDAPLAVVSRYRSLMRFVIEYIRSRGTKRFHIQTKTAHDLADLWESLGFKTREKCLSMMMGA